MLTERSKVSLSEIRTALAKATPGPWRDELLEAVEDPWLLLVPTKADGVFVTMLVDNAEALIESAEKIQLIEENACSIVTDHYLKAMIEVAETAQEAKTMLELAAIASSFVLPNTSEACKRTASEVGAALEKLNARPQYAV